MFTYPWRLLVPRTQKTSLTGRVVSGGPTLGNIIQTGDTSGGGLWRTTHTGVWLHTPEMIKCHRVWSRYLARGATQFILPVWDLGQAPRGFAGGKLALPGSPAPSTDYFNQDPGYGSTLITASIVDPSPIRATTLKGLVSIGSALTGAETFSINHATKGWRKYDVGRILSEDDSGQVFEIDPPSREALSGGEPMEFDVPRYQAMLDPAKADDYEADIESNRFATVNGYFIEAFS